MLHRPSEPDSSNDTTEAGNVPDKTWACIVTLSAFMIYVSELQALMLCAKLNAWSTKSKQYIYYNIIGHFPICIIREANG